MTTEGDGSGFNDEQDSTDGGAMGVAVPPRAWRWLHDAGADHKVQPYFVTYNGRDRWEHCRVCDQVPHDVILMRIKIRKGRMLTLIMDYVYLDDPRVRERMTSALTGDEILEIARQVASEDADRQWRS